MYKARAQKLSIKQTKAQKLLCTECKKIILHRTDAELFTIKRDGFI